MSDTGATPQVELYDTTLRDGAQQADLSYTVEDRLRILHKLDQVGFPYVEGGWPGANPRDTEFFQLATKETLKTSTLTAFGMTRRTGERADDSQALRDLLDAGTEVVCLVGKAWDLHVTEALRTDLDEGVAMVRESIEFLHAQGRRVFFDAEHFFDGHRSDSTFAMAVLASAEEAGAER
ncbi:MAG: citramalate synthase, partial [Actinomycetota bacterium]